MFAFLVAFMLIYCCPVCCMQTRATQSRLEEHRVSNPVHHYSFVRPEEVQNCINTERYTIMRTITRTEKGIKIEFSGSIEWAMGYHETISAQRAAQLFTAFIQKYNLIEKSPEQWLKGLKEKLI